MIWPRISSSVYGYKDDPKSDQRLAAPRHPGRQPALSAAYSVAASTRRPDAIGFPRALATLSLSWVDADGRGARQPESRRTREEMSSGIDGSKRAGDVRTAHLSSSSRIALLERFHQAADRFGCAAYLTPSPIFPYSSRITLEAEPQSFGGGNRPNRRSMLNPMASKRRSLLTGPSSSSPTGRPELVNPAGRLSPGIPALLPGSVLRI
jgi:hypothetical protein